MTKRLKRFAPVQLGKMLAALYGAMGLLFSPFFLFFGAITAAIPQSPNGPQIPTGMGIGMGIGMAIFFPFMYALIGFIIGIIGAFIYNIIAKFVGGIEVEVE